MSDLIVTLTKAADRDPEGTAELIDLAMYALAYDEMAHVDSRVFKAAHDAATTTVAKAKAGLVRSYVSKAVSGEYPEAEYLRQATYLQGISDFIEVAKESWETWNMDSGQLRRRVARDASGRFISISGNKAVAGTKDEAFRAGRLGPVHERTRRDNGYVQLAPGVDESEKDALNRFQGAYENAQQEAFQAKKLLGDQAKDARVLIQTGDPNQEDFEVPLEWLANPNDGDNLKKLGAQFQNLDQHITGMKVIPGKDATDEQMRRVAEFNGLGVLGQIDAVTRGNKKGIKQIFTPRAPGETRSDVAMGRIGIAGQVIGSVAPSAKIGILARYIGAYGPEAAQVLSPHMKRAAYRYRGTERTADPEITSQLHGRVGATVDRTAAAIDSGQITPAMAGKQIGGPGDPNWAEPGYQSLRTRSLLNPKASGDSLKLGVRSDVAAAELLKTLPKNALIDVISRKANRGLPSQGVIIDRDGNVVSQSVGYAGDHYLPFNLANLSRLRGGQYVRTRQSGGLTGEDIFTAVYSGARSATVASTSGVFRIEFSPDFRGGRAMSDKAGSMYETYLNILHTIDTETDLYSKPLDPDTLDAIETVALRSGPLGSDAFKAKFEEEKKKAIAEATTITAKDRAEIKARAEANNPGDERGAAAQVEQELYDLRQEKMSQVNLNGEGYALALKTLQEQYPYFIRSVEYTPLRGNPKYDKEDVSAMAGVNIGSLGFFGRLGMRSNTARSSGGRDANYVAPGQEPWRERPAAPEQKPAEAAPTTGGAAPGGAPNAPAAPGAPKTTPAPTTSSNSPAGQHAAAKAGLSTLSQKKAAEDFIKPFASILRSSTGGLPEQGQNPRAIGDMNAPFADFASEPLSEQIEYLLWRSSSMDLAKTIRENPEQAFKALSAPESEWKAALSSAFSADGIKDVAETQNIWGTDNVNDLVAEARARAKHVLDIELAAQPFAADTPDALLSVTGQAIDFADITSATDADSFTKRLEDPDLKELMPLVAELGVDSKGHSQSLADAGEKMGVIIDGLKKLEDARVAMAGNPALLGRDYKDVIASLDLHKDFYEHTTIDDLDIARLLNLTKNTDQHTETEIMDLAKKWQRARTILEVARAYDLVKAGGAFPKAWEAIAPAWVKANRPPGWTPRVEKAHSSRRAHPASPAARRMGVRKALRIPLVHPRSASPR